MRNIHYTPFLLFFICLSHLLPAQSVSPDLTEGMELYKAQKYYKAAHHFAHLIQQQELKEVELVRAHFFLGQSYLSYVRERANFRHKLPLAVSKAYTHTQTAVVLGKNSRYQEAGEAGLVYLQPYLYNEGVFHYNKNNFDDASYYFEKALLIDPSDFQSMMGQSFASLAKGDTSEAVAYFEAMGDQPVMNIDMLSPEMEKAYDILSNYSKNQAGMLSSENPYTNSRLAFPTAITLEEKEIAVYQEENLSLQKSISLFEEVLSKYPEDTQSALAYATLLNSIGKGDTAMHLYAQVLGRDPLNKEAHKQIAVFHLNKAVELKENPSETGASSSDAMEELKLAYPHFQQLHQMDPNDQLWLKKLLTISRMLHLEEAEMYQEKWDSLLAGEKK
ncbi:MAG: tetratricopeptide repeat protein [Bacteroidota bacterium]